MAKARRSGGKAVVERQMVLERDVHMAVVPADMCAVAFLGRDFEVSMFAMTPLVKRMWGSANPSALGPSKIESDIVHREVGKFRMGSATVAQIALNLAMALKSTEPDSFEVLVSQLLKTSDSEFEPISKDDLKVDDDLNLTGTVPMKNEGDA